MKTLEQEKLDQILFAVRVLGDNKNDIDTLLKVSFPLFFTEELDFNGALEKVVEIFRNQFERDGTYTFPNANTPLNEMEDFQSLDPDFRIMVLEKVFSLNEIVPGERKKIEEAFQQKKIEIKRLYENKTQAIFLRNWQRDLVRPKNKSWLFTFGPIALFLLGILYLIFRGSGII